MVVPPTTTFKEMNGDNGVGIMTRGKYFHTALSVVRSFGGDVTQGAVITPPWHG